jgi:hypothetical protein
LLGSAGAAAQTCLYPHAHCRTWFISEFGLLRAFENQLQAGPVQQAYWELGMMKRLSARTAIGGSAYASYDDVEFRRVLAGVKVRGRRWLTRAVTLDASAGLLLVTSGDQRGLATHLNLPGFTGRLDLGLADWIGATAGVDIYGLTISPSVIEPGITRLKDERHTWYAGLRLGKYPAVLAGVAVAILLPIVHRFS